MGKVRWSRLHLDPVLAACFAALLAFPLGASLAARGQPLDPQPRATPAPPDGGGVVAQLRRLPAFSTASPLQRSVATASLLSDEDRMGNALASALRDLVGARRAARVMRLVTGADPISSSPAADGNGAAYPFRYPTLEPLLDSALTPPLADRRTRAANDVAALLVLAAAAHEDAFSGAPAVAFALLHRARAGNACVPQRNLAFVLSTNTRPHDDAVRTEFLKAQRACGSDATPAWMLGQFQSMRAGADEPGLLQRPFATFRALQRRAPRSVLGWSGEADTQLRLAYLRSDLQPFTARAHFRRALGLYRHAQRLDARSPALAAGAARALAGLGEHGAAVREQRRAVAGRATLAPVAARQVEYLERAHRFGAAATAARPLVAGARFPPPRSLVVLGAPDAFVGRLEGPVVAEDAAHPLSIGVDGMHAVSLNVGVDASALSPAVTDLSFIPAFRVVYSVTDHDRWCPAWSIPRDLLLSGDPAGALRALPDGMRDIRTGVECERDLTLVAAMAELEAGGEARALARLAGADYAPDAEREGFPPRPTLPGARLAALYETQQNTWRFAGRLDLAGKAARAWLRRLPTDPQAADRLGEIAFLTGQYDAAARWFARVARLAYSAPGGDDTQLATGLLKRGTALQLAGRRGEAVAVLERADEAASRARRRSEDPAALFASYHARVQAGDALLRTGRYADAAEAYSAAREREPDLRTVNALLLARPEALHNNQAIAEAKLGHHAEAVDAAARAVDADPESPLFLETKGFALRRAGRLPEAAEAYRAAVRADPTAYTAWNDLGVVLARRGNLDDAVRALRRAVGVRPRYALAWFNLGVAQARRGLSHALASQGAFGRAFSADEGLRDRRRRYIADDAIAFTNLDLSKPLPARWSYATRQEQAPVAAAGLALLVLLGIRLGRRLLASRFGGDLAGKLIDPLMLVAQRYPRVPIYTPWLVAVLATVATFSVGLLAPGAGGPIEAIVLVAGVIALIAIVVRGRSLAARAEGVRVGQRGWTPGIALGAAAAAFGTAWAPLPVAEPSAPAPAVHWIGPVLTGTAALALLVMAAWLAVPGTLALAAAALVMTASLLTPTKPLDGGYVATGTAGVAVALALVGGGLFFVLGVG